MSCQLCDSPGGEILWQDDFCRIVLVTDTPDYPGFCRVILRRHVKEMTDLAPDDRSRLMGMVWKTEQAVRETMHPDKINLASLGNVVPHLHWHVVPRFLHDPHFPNPIWGEAVREPIPQAGPSLGDALRSVLQRKP
jgi:diadenosine tetraphosphate (Ap4A) HIT family hydrolase